MDAEEDEKVKQTDPAAIFGLGRSGGSDIAKEGREAVEEAVAAHHDNARR